MSGHNGPDGPDSDEEIVFTARPWAQSRHHHIFLSANDISRLRAAAVEMDAAAAAAVETTPAVAAAATVAAVVSTQASTSTSAETSVVSKKRAFITRPEALLAVAKRLRVSNDNLAYRTSGGLRIMLRNDPDPDVDHEDANVLAFDVSVITDNESSAIIRSIKNEVDIMEDESGCVVIEEYEFGESDDDALKSAMDFLNEVDQWTVCACGEYLIKDFPATECYLCELTHAGDPTDIFCPICHEPGRARWMTTTTCCAQQLHAKCKTACKEASGTTGCPMCRSTLW